MAPRGKKRLTVTLQRVSGGSLGIAINVNQLTAVHPGGAGEAAGLQVGDWIAEVNGKDLLFGSFGSLIPKDLTAPIKLRVERFST